MPKYSVATALAIAFIAFSQEAPTIVRQGDTIRILSSPDAVAARLSGKTVKLFLHEGKAVGQMPIEVNHSTGTYSLEILDGAGRVIQTQTFLVEHVPFPTQNIVINRAKKEMPPSPGEMETVAALRDSVTPVRFWSEPFLKPTNDCMNSPFGVRRLHNGKPSGSYHRGLDQRSKQGTPVRAIAGGVVRISRMWNIHGGTVGIDHGQGVTSFYLHLSKFGTEEDARIAAGDVIGYVGSTGFATGPHLHWQLTVNGVPVNPNQWVSGIEPCPVSPAPKKRRQPAKSMKKKGQLTGNKNA